MSTQDADATVHCQSVGTPVPKQGHSSEHPPIRETKTMITEEEGSGRGDVNKVGLPLPSQLLRLSTQGRRRGGAPVPNDDYAMAENLERYTSTQTPTERNPEALSHDTSVPEISESNEAPRQLKASMILKLSVRQKKNDRQEGVVVLESSGENLPSSEDKATQKSARGNGRTETKNQSSLLLRGRRSRREAARSSRLLVYDISKLWSRRKARVSNVVQVPTKQKSRRTLYLDTIRENGNSISAKLSLYEDAAYDDGALMAEKWSNEAAGEAPTEGKDTAARVINATAAAVDADAGVSLASVSSRGHAEGIMETISSDEGGEEEELTFELGEDGSFRASRRPTSLLLVPNDTQISTLTIDVMDEEDDEDESVSAEMGSVATDELREPGGWDHELTYGSVLIAIVESDREHASSSLLQGSDGDSEQKGFERHTDESFVSVIPRVRSSRLSIREIEQPHLLKVNEAKEWLDSLNKQNEETDAPQRIPSKRQISVVGL